MIEQRLYTELTFDEFADLMHVLRNDESVEFHNVNVMGNDKIGPDISDLRFTILIKIK